MDQLLFVWVEKFRNIENVGFNFSNRYEINYKKGENEIIVNTVDGESVLKEDDVKLLFNDEKHYLEDFFQIENKNNVTISQICALIGKNSSGKSNIIDFILTAISIGSRNKLQSNYILVFKKDNELCFFGKTNNNNLNTSTLICLNKNVPKIEPDKNWVSMFYSNVADNKEHIFNDSSVYNYSFNKLNELQSNKIDFVSSIFFEDTWKRLNTKDSPIKNVRFVFNPISFLRIEKANDLDERLAGILKRYRKAIYEESSSNANRFYYGLVINLLCFLYESKLDISPILQEVNLVGSDGFAEAIRILHPKVVLFLAGINEMDSDTLKKDEFDSYKNLINQFSLKDEDGKVVVYNLGQIDNYNNSILVDFNDDFKKILLDNQIAFNNSSLITHDWSQLSSGLKAYLNLFSQLFDLSSKVTKPNNQNILICIDEGDLYLHPEWQKNFLNDLIWFLEQIFTNINIQLLLTSHSPFLISDLPKENVILLDKDCKPDRQLNQSSSFGANIHQLYNKQFFLINGAIGEFARIKISNILSELKYVNKTTLEKYEKLISMIGEPVLRIRLEEELQKYVKMIGREALIEWHKSQILQLNKEIE
ncbi:hypothetical protein IX39_12310 [Chryseobacterium formosense]|uniref:ATPase AAA-type core domain-containing protein n=1 Tax=Chryseobacterium formosense TaxID=236814 RepID=A0A085ZA87_9FLAO|nr:AAA family ATPase [Chryseobacterium formosense]KFF01351.1 hypothetical protein IX39_12310 [Chryseobacterium formosense]SFT46100.1 AAA domain-containing protein, putative AbiEii toxin, Type IV TA system [Chryseobacterium formosense]